MNIQDKLESAKNYTNGKISKKFLAAALLVGGALFLTDYAVVASLVMLSVITPLALNRLELKGLGIELVTLTTVVIGIKFGPESGAIAGLLLMATHMISGQFNGAYLLWVIPSYAGIGFVAGIAGMEIAMLGLALTVGANVLFTLLTMAVTPEGVKYFVPHAAGNILFNAVIFTQVAPQILALTA